MEALPLWGGIGTAGKRNLPVPDCRREPSGCVAEGWVYAGPNIRPVSAFVRTTQEPGQPAIWWRTANAFDRPGHDGRAKTAAAGRASRRPGASYCRNRYCGAAPYSRGTKNYHDPG